MLFSLHYFDDIYTFFWFLFHKLCWFIDYDSIFNVYSFDILSTFMFL